MAFRSQLIPSIFILSIGLAVVSPNAFVSAQKSQPDLERANQKSQPYLERVNNIKSQIFQAQKVKTMCADVRSINFNLKGDKLRIITGNHLCSYTIVQEVLQPQLSAGKIQTFEFSANQEDVIVTL